MPKWGSGSRLEEIELMLITNKTALFSGQHTLSHPQLMKLVEDRCKLEVEKASILNHR